MDFICPSEPSTYRVNVSHMVIECRVVNNHPCRIKNLKIKTNEYNGRFG